MRLFGIESAVSQKPHEGAAYGFETIRLRRLWEVVQIEKHPVEPSGAAYWSEEVQL